MSITVTFACGHEMAVGENVGWVPVCVCGNKHVARVRTPRPPRFVGTVTGPYAETKALEPGVVNVAPGGALNIKQEKRDG